MLKQFEGRKKGEPNAIKKTKPFSDLDVCCFRCNNPGHWAKDCPLGHEPEWLMQQACFKCGKTGHLKADCPTQQIKGKISNNTFFDKPPTSKPKKMIQETGIWFSKDKNDQNWLASSPDGLVTDNGVPTAVLEIKCPYMSGKPVPLSLIHI